MHLSNRRRLPAAIALLLLAAARLGAQGLPTPQQLAARHDSLVGGRAVLEAHKSLHLIGTFAIPAFGIDAPLEMMKLKPNKYLFRSALGPAGEMLTGFDGKTAWGVQPGQGPMLMTGAQAEQLAEQANFYATLHDFTKYTTVETLAETDFEGKRAYPVQMVKASGDTTWEYYEVATGLSLGGVTVTLTPAGRVEFRSILAEYKEFNGLRLATKVIQRNPQFEVILTFTNAIFDTLDESSVAPPAAVQALIKP